MEKSKKEMIRRLIEIIPNRLPPPMIQLNQFGVCPGVYEHYKGSIYVVETILTHQKNVDGGNWIHLQDPLVIYRNLEPQFADVNGIKKMVIKTYSRPLSNFDGFAIIEGKPIKRFKPA